MKKILFILLITPLLSASAKNIFDRMDEKTSVSTGVYKLSKQEQDKLLKWLESSKKEIVKEEKKKNMGFRREEVDREYIQSTIVGEFNGWQGKNVFKLENGQIWKQAERTSFYIRKRNDPKVTLKPKSMGSWIMYVDGFGRGVRVKRVK